MLLPPSQFLPPLPRGYPQTLSPLISDRLEECIASLRVLMLPSLVGIDGAVVEQGETVRGGADPRHTSDTDSGAGAKVGQGQVDECEIGEEDEVIMDEFENKWAENWLNQIIRRGETWITELEGDDHEEVEGKTAIEAEDVYGSHETEHDPTEPLSLCPPISPVSPESSLIPSREPSRTELEIRHEVLRSAASLVSLLSGCSASGAILRTLCFPLNPKFLASSRGTHPEFPERDVRRLTIPNPSVPDRRDLVIKINDAPLADHLSVGVQTWGSSVLLGREMASDPARFGLNLRKWYARSEGLGGDRVGAVKAREGGNRKRAVGPRILELGAGTGVLSIVCRALLDLSADHDPTRDEDELAHTDRGQTSGTVIATDYHPLVLSNLRACVELNFPSSAPSGSANEEKPPRPAITVMPLDWSTFPQEAERVLTGRSEGGTVDRLDLIGRIKEVGARKGLWSLPVTPSPTASPGSTPLSGRSSGNDDKDLAVGAMHDQRLPPPLDEPFDMLLACDCVYDLTHATLLRETASWLLRLPDTGFPGDRGGVLHLLSPVRRTYSEETTSIVKAFPTVDSVPPRRPRADAKTGNITPGGSRSGVSTPRSNASTAHSASAVDLVALRSGMATPVDLSEEDQEIFGQGMGLGRAGGWRLCAVERQELERLNGNGRSDELVYMWWTIMWC